MKAKRKTGGRKKKEGGHEKRKGKVADGKGEEFVKVIMSP
jgi:hypothetical protein